MATQDPLKERFEILRRRARQAATTATQQEQEGLRRRFAQLGQVGSGAQIKTEAQAAERGAKRLQRAEETVGLAELGERQRLAEQAEARQFARGEREAAQRFAAQQAGIGRQFAAAQAEAQRKFARGERLSAQDFAALKAGEQRQFATGEREAAQKFARRERAAGQAFTRDMQEQANRFRQMTFEFQQRAFDEGVRQFDETFGRDSVTIDFNRRMAEQAADQTLWDQLGLGGFTPTAFQLPESPIKTPAFTF